MKSKENNCNTNWLTSIRGFACLIVLIAHIFSKIPVVGLNVSGAGKIGVWLFFVLSAFLLTSQLLKKDKIGLKDILEFYIKRVFRIFPCYIIVLIFALALGYLSNIQQVIKHIFLIEGIGHFWTIPVEFLFYLLVPILLVIIKKIDNEKISCVLLLIIFSITAIIFPYTEYVENSINLKWYIPVFLMGMLLVFVYNKFLGKERKKIIYDVIAVFILICMLCSIPYFRKLIFNIPPDNYLQNKYLFLGLAWCIIIICIQNSKYIINYLNNSRFFTYIGNISFPIYLIHYVILNKMNFNNMYLSSIFVIIFSIGVAILINKLIEKPMIKISKKINKKLFLGGDSNGKV